MGFAVLIFSLHSGPYEAILFLLMPNGPNEPCEGRSLTFLYVQSFCAQRVWKGVRSAIGLRLGLACKKQLEPRKKRNTRKIKDLQTECHSPTG
jgi:hypothetical protein